MLEERLKRPLDTCKEPPRFVLPSIHLGTDGPVLRSVFFTTDMLLCEVVEEAGALAFDFVSLASVFNYRVELSTHRVEKADGDATEYQIATLTLRHSSVGSFMSLIAYAGFERDEWLSDVLRALPVGSVIRTLP